MLDPLFKHNMRSDPALTGHCADAERAAVRAKIDDSRIDFFMVTNDLMSVYTTLKSKGYILDLDY
jgi:hypothetical protein